MREHRRARCLACKSGAVITEHRALGIVRQRGNVSVRMYRRGFQLRTFSGEKIMCCAVLGTHLGTCIQLSPSVGRDTLRSDRVYPQRSRTFQAICLIHRRWRCAAARTRPQPGMVRYPRAPGALSSALQMRCRLSRCLYPKPVASTGSVTGLQAATLTQQLSAQGGEAPTCID